MGALLMLARCPGCGATPAAVVIERDPAGRTRRLLVCLRCGPYAERRTGPVKISARPRVT